MNNNDEKTRKELYDDMIKKSNSSKRKKINTIWSVLGTTLKSFKIVIIIVVIIIVFACMYLFKDSTNVFVDVEEFIESNIGEITLVSATDTDDYQNGVFTFKLDKIPEIKIHAYKKYFNLDADGLDRVYKYLFNKWDNPNKNKFVVEEYYKDVEFIDNKIINDWLLVYNTCIEITNYSELMEATELVLDFAQYEEKMINHYSNFSCSIRFNDEFINPYNESKDKILEYVQEWYVNIVKENNLDSSDIPNEILEKY